MMLPKNAFLNLDIIDFCTDGINQVENPPSFKYACGGTQKPYFEPNKNMREIHKMMIIFMQNLDFPHPSDTATACRRGDSVENHILRHRGNNFLYLLDLKRAYLNINGWKLAEIIANLQLADKENIFQFLEKYFLIRGGLIISCPASSYLFNLYAGQLIDKKLAGFCKENNITFTRYLDDLLFSSKELFSKRIRKKIQQVITEAGFIINHRKSRLYNLRKGPIVLNGIGLKLGGRLFIPSHFLKKIRGLLHKMLNKALFGTVTKREIGMVHGYMGTIPVTIGLVRSFTRAEQKIMEKYQKFKQALKY